MGLIEELSLKTSNKLGKKLDKNNEEIAVINYGLFTILHTSLAIIVTMVVGLLTKTLIEIMTISITSAVLKRYSGGVHATSPERCTLIGVILAYILSYISISIMDIDMSITILMIISIIGFSYYILYKKCPVPSKNKPLKKESTRKKLRKKAFNLINIYVVLIIISLSIYLINNVTIAKSIALSMVLGIGLQVFVLTSLGGKLINLLDNLFNINKFLSKNIS